MTIHHYSYAGLSIGADLELPELERFATATPDAVEVRLIVAPAIPVAGNGWSFIDDRHWRFAVPDIGSFDIVDGSSIVIAPAPQSTDAELRLFLLGSAWSALCYQRGLLPFHASAVRVGDGAIAFCGPSGAGKSSTAAWLVAHGFDLVTEDLTVCRCGPGEPPAIWPSIPRLKLWSDAVCALQWDSVDLQRDLYRADKYFRVLDDGVETGVTPVPLKAIYLLDWGDARVTRLAGSVALRGLIAAADYRADLLQSAARRATHWRQFLGIAQAVPVFRLTRPRSWSRLDAIMTTLTADW